MFSIVNVTFSQSDLKVMAEKITHVTLWQKKSVNNWWQQKLVGFFSLFFFKKINLFKVSGKKLFKKSLKFANQVMLYCECLPNSIYIYRLNLYMMIYIMFLLNFRSQTTQTWLFFQLPFLSGLGDLHDIYFLSSISWINCLIPSSKYSVFK